MQQYFTFATSSPDTKTTHELLYGMPPGTINLKMFGCRAYVCVHKANRITKFSGRVTLEMYAGSQNDLHYVYIKGRTELMTTEYIAFDETVSAL